MNSIVDVDVPDAIIGRYVYMFFDNRDQVTLLYSKTSGFCPASANTSVPTTTTSPTFRVSSPTVLTDLVLNLPWNNYTNALAQGTMESTYVNAFASMRIYCNGISVDSGWIMQDIYMGHCTGRRIIPTYQFLPGYDYSIKCEYVDPMTLASGGNDCGPMFIKFETTGGVPLILFITADAANNVATASYNCSYVWGYANDPFVSTQSIITVPSLTSLVAGRVYCNPAGVLAVCTDKTQHVSIGVKVNGIPSNVRIPLDSMLWWVGDGIHFPLHLLPGNTYQFYTIQDPALATSKFEV